ncbi:MAG: NAD(P)/FAD-dependent oxidoreductase [Deltaproteobacteria bacterium]|nr:NAD(P)/FAD-dependent oxidoreductase [Deltaproteobacteria bacterium]
MSKTDYVIAGAGVAGIEAAAAIRARDPDGRIMVVGEEPHPFYARIRLGELIDGRVGVERLILKKDEWYRDNSIDLRTGVRVEGFDTKAAVADLSDGARVQYDRLLLAVGARPFMPPFPGSDLPGVRTLRTIDDALKIKSLAADARAAVVIGGGLLGLEAAVSLVNSGLDVTVVDVSRWLLPRQVDPKGGGVVQGILEGMGLHFRIDAKVGSIEGRGRVESVELAGGESLSASLVLVAAGIRPEVGPARDSGIEVDRGIKVDDRLTTSAHGVFAAGDCAQHRGRVYGIWPASEAQGRIAGAVMAGEKASYEGTIPLNTLKIAGVAVFSIGDIDPENTGDTETLQSGHVYRRLTRDEKGRLKGAVLVGDIKERRRIIAAVGEGKPYPEKG